MSESCSAAGPGPGPGPDSEEAETRPCPQFAPSCEQDSAQTEADVKDGVCGYDEDEDEDEEDESVSFGFCWILLVLRALMEEEAEV